jgi:hypothetical protein
MYNHVMKESTSHKRSCLLSAYHGNCRGFDCESLPRQNLGCAIFAGPARNAGGSARNGRFECLSYEYLGQITLAMMVT